MAIDYKQTLNLPTTSFDMRANLAAREPLLLQFWQEQDLYRQILASRQDCPAYILHDGPPYANGHLHHGHILNKVLKDIVVKNATMSGCSSCYVPGWDCHGLPIEVQVDKLLGERKATLSKIELRAECRAYAAKFVDLQREEFKRLGIFGQWETPYLTMDYHYEAETVRALAKFVEHGLLYKGLRTIAWCAQHRTALAEAEVEYAEGESPSLYVAFLLTKHPAGLATNEPVYVAIWTTTPWTLPANLAICLHPEVTYVAYRVQGKICIFARELGSSFLAALHSAEPFSESKILATFTGKELAGLTYKHPLYERESPLILGEHVLLDSGTACVHTAPGHGAEDYAIGLKYGLEIFSPVDAAGCLTARAGRFAGLSLKQANQEIIQELAAVGALLNPVGEVIQHRVAHCWRCHKPVFTRATEQWFVALDKPYTLVADDSLPAAAQATATACLSLRERALRAIEEVSWVPSWGKERIKGMLATRPDWCVSRQRLWGVPIVAFYCTACGEVLLDAALLYKAAEIFAQAGADAWFSKSIEELVGPLTCKHCGGTKFTQETDILDVWFDSGVSFAAVLGQKAYPQLPQKIADVYLEGSDQHRGWFHSALLCALAMRGVAPYREVITHGFLVDGEGKKFSKSQGNVLDPFKMIAKDGAEILRLWVAAEDFQGDIRISPEILKRLTDMYRKIRNTLRYMLGNLADFNPEVDSVASTELEELDQYALWLTAKQLQKMQQSYAAYEFHQVVSTLNEFCNLDLSAFYFDILKDRLYCFKPQSLRRRSAQTALYLIAHSLLRTIAPILSFTAEEAWACLPKLKDEVASVHLSFYPFLREARARLLKKSGDLLVDSPGVTDRFTEMIASLQETVGRESQLPERYEYLREVRKRVNAALEVARQQKLCGSSTEAAVQLTVSPDDEAKLASFGVESLAEIFIVAEVVLLKATAQAAEIEVNVVKATGQKCSRCWLHKSDVGSHPEHRDFCLRCVDNL